MPCYIGVFSEQSVEYCTGLFVWGLEVNLNHEPLLHTPLPQPGEQKPPVPTQTDLYNTPQTALIKHLYNMAYGHYTHTLHIISFFTVQKTICCNSTSNAPDDGHMYPKHVELRIHQ